MSAPTVWCPSCGAEYSVGSRYCSDCRVELVAEPPDAPRPAEADDDTGDLVEMGDFPRLAAQVFRRRLESAGIPVMVEWTYPTGTILVPEAQAEFAEAVINEIEVDDEVPDSSPEAYMARIEEHLSAISGLLDELRTRLDESRS